MKEEHKQAWIEAAKTPPVAKHESPIPFKLAGLSDAFEEVASLLELGSSRDTYEGPRWLKQSRDELWEHLFAHIEEIEDDTSLSAIRIDKDTRHMTAAHVVARALMILQHDINNTKRS